MYIDFSNSPLPITDIIPEIKEHLSAHNTLLISAPPGAGKSTVLPLALLNEPWLGTKKIIMLEPRRLAARTIATRMAELLEESVGKTIGYRVRLDTCVSASTRIEVVTEGILTRMLQNDNALESVGLVIFDEFHERHLQTDLAMVLCRDAQSVLRPDLRIVVMSATLDVVSLKTLLGAPVVQSEGRQFPVEIIYSSDADELLLSEMACDTIVKASKEREGDILAFLPGEAEIHTCAAILKTKLSTFSIHPLYAMLPWHEQYRAIMPHRDNKRKIVLATSIAETSLTIEGIRIVVDCGFTRRSKADPASGLSRLQTVRISKDIADQRAGRAGRLAPGACYRMWSKATHERLAEHRTPEILEAELSPLVLEVSKWGAAHIKALSWITPPPDNAIGQASDVLHQIGALENGKITAHGKRIHQLGCHPRIGHMLLMATTEQQKTLACDIAAILEERDPLPRESGIDLNLRIEALRRFREHPTQNPTLKRIQKNAENYYRLLQLKPIYASVDPYETGLLLAYAFPERIASAKPGNNAQFMLANGKLAMASHNDDLAHEPWITIASMNLSDNMGKIFLAAPLDPTDLAHLVKEKTNILWDTRKGGLISTTELRIGSLVLQSRPLPQPDEHTVTEVICQVLKSEGDALLNFNDEFLQLQNRIISLSLWNPHENWPSVTTEHLLSVVNDWIGTHLLGVKKNEDLKKINLSQCLFNYLSYEQQKKLELLAPAKIKMPSGSFLPVQYFSDGSAPIVAVRLQEVFGLPDTPTINEGKIKVVLRLLSPGYKPVQVTSDLKSFWNNTYHEVKKELQRRYPKHSWPDDPWNTKAVAKGRSVK
ncbi:MAG: ATP-dependent helicase HrpB [Cytophagaceae bacterium]|nr:ATP-dependent helicase HrpB [Cytophagaceae bacterium]MDW8455524.1 ATP-dependent helicase HrpB [Cytophagaceae bacterium]